MMPRLRILLSSVVAMFCPRSGKSKRTTEKQRAQRGDHRNQIKGTGNSTKVIFRSYFSIPLILCVSFLCALCASVVRYLRIGLPSEVRERLVGFGHLCGIFALGHGFTFTAVGGHKLIGQSKGHGSAGLGASGANDPADRQAALAR